MIRELLYVIVGFAVLAYGAEFAFSLKDDPREPPRVKSKIPLIGHIIGVVRGGMGYYNTLSKNVDSDMFTLGIFGFKVYVCNSRSLMPAIQKNSKTLSFKPFVRMSMKKNSDVSDHAYELGTSSMIDKLDHAQRTALAPGPYLNDQTSRTGEGLVNEMSNLEVDAQGAKPVMLLDWVRHAVVKSTGYGIYGTTHPWRDPKVEEAFWTWHEYMPLMFTLKILARKGFRGRQVVFDAYQKYFQNIPDDTAQVFKERQRVYKEAGIDEHDRAKLEATWPIAIFCNTVPTIYWTIWEIYSRPDLLAEVRQEVSKEAVTGQNDGFLLDIPALKSRCHLLLSVIQETQRLRHKHATARKVEEETLLDGRYLLKKGNVVQMPGSPIHYSTDVYGPTAGEFDPYRFVPGKGKEPFPGSSFLAWGSPPTLCPARQFAAAEMLILSALLVMRFDLIPSSGAWDKSPALRIGEIVTLLSPKKDVMMDVTLREDWSGKWSLEMGEGKSRVPLTSG